MSVWPHTVVRTSERWRQRCSGDGEGQTHYRGKGASHMISVWHPDETWPVCSSGRGCFFVFFLTGVNHDFLFLDQVLLRVLMRMEKAHMHLSKQLGLLLGDPAPGAWQQKLLYSSHVSVATSSVTTAIGCFLDAWLQRHAAPSVMFQKIKVLFFFFTLNTILSLRRLTIPVWPRLSEPTRADDYFCLRPKMSPDIWR